MNNIYGENTLSLATAKKLLGLIDFSQRRNKAHNKGVNCYRRIKNIEINEKDIIRKYEDQKGLCYWSGLPLNEEYNFIKFHPFAISVERLENDGDYTYDNIVLVRRFFNLGRMAFPLEEYRVCVKSLIEDLRKKI